MATSNRRAGLLELTINGVRYDLKGDFSYNIGSPMRNEIVGPSGVHGFSEETQVPYIEGAFTDRDDLDLRALTTIDNEEVLLTLNNGKTIVLQEAWYAADGKVTTNEGEIAVKFCGKRCEEI